MKNIELIKEIDSIGINFSNIVAQKLFDIKRKKLNKTGSSINITATNSSFLNNR